ncbi:MAG: cyclase family protein [Bacteroidetes bacterium]|nr:cyclase family protein [Bacteroidota bacterium]MCL5026057.1 cyclase family protein [Chloroflexota bacterium]
MLRYSRLVDLSQVLHPGKEARRLKIEMIGADTVADVARLPGQWYIMHNVSIVTHIGTHIEVPYHILQKGNDLAQVPLESLMGEAVVLDLTAAPPRSEIGAGQLREATAKVGGIRRGDIVFVGSDYEGERQSQSPYLGTDAVDWLVAQGIKMIGFDGGMEVPGSEHHVNHHAFLDRDICIIENVVNLREVRAARFTAIALPIAVEKLESFPLRVIALED